MIPVNNNTITLDEARNIIGSENTKYSDKDIAELIAVFEFLADIVIDNKTKNPNVYMKTGS